MTLQPYQQRVVEEREALEINIVALGSFIENGDVFDRLPNAERLKLTAQVHTMRAYSSILAARIAAFESGEA